MENISEENAEKLYQNNLMNSLTLIKWLIVVSNIMMI
jgi:hypothetical protein